MSIQQVYNNWPIQTSCLDTVSSVATRGSGYKRDTIRNGRTELRTEIVATQGESICECVVVGQVRAIIITQCTAAVGGHETIHGSIVPFLMNVLPGMR